MLVGILSFSFIPVIETIKSDFFCFSPGFLEIISSILDEDRFEFAFYNGRITQNKKPVVLPCWNQCGFFF